MLKIKNDKLYGKNYAFALPQGFNFKVQNEVFCGKGLKFQSDDGEVNIEIFIVDDCNCAKKDLMDVVNDGGFVRTGDFVEVKRGSGTGIGLFYKSCDGNEEHYEERFDFKKSGLGETQFDVDVYTYFGKGKPKLTIKEVLELPSVKAFLKSIEYFD